MWKSDIRTRVVLPSPLAPKTVRDPLPKGEGWKVQDSEALSLWERVG